MIPVEATGVDVRTLGVDPALTEWVLLGPVARGVVRTTGDVTGTAYWRLGDPDAVAARIGAGELVRLHPGEPHHREVALLERGSSRMFLLHQRSLDAGAPALMDTVALTPAGAPATAERPVAELAAQLRRWLETARTEGGDVVVEPVDGSQSRVRLWFQDGEVWALASVTGAAPAWTAQPEGFALARAHADDEGTSLLCAMAAEAALSMGFPAWDLTFTLIQDHTAGALWNRPDRVPPTLLTREGLERRERGGPPDDLPGVWFDDVEALVEWLRGWPEDGPGTLEEFSGLELVRVRIADVVCEVHPDSTRDASRRWLELVDSSPYFAVINEQSNQGDVLVAVTDELHTVPGFAVTVWEPEDWLEFVEHEPIHDPVWLGPEPEGGLKTRRPNWLAAHAPNTLSFLDDLVAHVPGATWSSTAEVLQPTVVLPLPEGGEVDLAGIALSPDEFALGFADVDEDALAGHEVMGDSEREVGDGRWVGFHLRKMCVEGFDQGSRDRAIALAERAAWLGLGLHKLVDDTTLEQRTEVVRRARELRGMGMDPEMALLIAEAWARAPELTVVPLPSSSVNVPVRFRVISPEGLVLVRILHNWFTATLAPDTFAPGRFAHRLVPGERLQLAEQLVRWQAQTRAYLDVDPLQRQALSWQIACAAVRRHPTWRVLEEPTDGDLWVADGKDAVVRMGPSGVRFGMQHTPLPWRDVLGRGVNAVVEEAEKQHGAASPEKLPASTANVLAIWLVSALVSMHLPRDVVTVESAYDLDDEAGTSTWVGDHDHAWDYLLELWDMEWEEWHTNHFVWSVRTKALALVVDAFTGGVLSTDGRELHLLDAYEECGRSFPLLVAKVLTWQAEMAPQ